MFLVNLFINKHFNHFSTPASQPSDLEAGKQSKQQTQISLPKFMRKLLQGKLRKNERTLPAVA